MSRSSERSANRWQEFALVWNDTEKYPEVRDVCEALGMTRIAVKGLTVRMRTAARAGRDVPALVSRAKGPDYKLLSEQENKFIENFTAEDCIKELRRIAEANPDSVISRNFFRVHSDISESTWNRYFGTFQEFKRQANIKLSRHVHAHERKVAIHASRDHYREMSVKRQGYAGRYLRERPGKFKTILVGTDLHDIECDPFFLRIFLDTAKRVQPDAICLNGDIFDLPEFGKYDVDPREWDVAGRIRFVWDNILGPLREVCPETQIDLIEGNHEFRLMRHLADATPAMRSVLSDLHGWTVSRLLGLDQYEVNYIAKGDLAAINMSDMKAELGKNYKNYWDCFIAHHFPEARHMGMPGWNGHHHKHEIWPFFNPQFGAYEWHQLGGGHRRAASYTQGEKWANGLLLAHCNVESKSTVMDYCPMTDFAVVGGEFYYRTEDEGLHNPAVWPGK